MKNQPDELRKRLLEKSLFGQPIVFHRVTPELLESLAEIDSTDLLLIDHTSSSIDRNPAAELLPLADANEELLKNAERFRDLLPRHNVIAGICGCDPFRLPEKLLERVKAMGFIGVQNTPSIGMIDGSFREHLENSHISYSQEVTMLTIAKQFGLITLGTVFSERHAKQMIAAGVDALVIHPGPKALIGKANLEREVILQQSIRKLCGAESVRPILLSLPSRPEAEEFII